jgi:hypothetical protein
MEWFSTSPTTKGCGSKIELLITVGNVQRGDLISLVLSLALKGFQE